MIPEKKERVKDEIITLGDIVESCSFCYRMRYEKLLKSFTKDPSNTRTKVVLLFNLNTIVAKSEHVAISRYAKMLQEGQIRAIDKDEQYRDRDITPFQVLAVLNTIAHYNRFFQHHLGTQPISSALYFPKPESYDKRSAMVELLNQVCRFIPNVHMTSKITGNTDLFQAHVPNAISMLLKRQCDARKQRLIILMICPTPIDWEVRRFAHEVHMVDPYHGVDHMLTFEEYLEKYVKIPKDIAHDSRYLHELINVFSGMLPFRRQLSSEFMPTNYPRIHTHKHLIGTKDGTATPEFRSFLGAYGGTPVKAAHGLFNFLTTDKDRTEPNRDAYLRLFRSMDFEERKDVMQIVKQMLPFWTQKLKDKSIASSLSKTFERFKYAQSLNVDWLLEGLHYGVE